MDAARQTDLEPNSTTCKKQARKGQQILLNMVRQSASAYGPQTQAMLCEVVRPCLRSLSHRPSYKGVYGVVPRAVLNVGLRLPARQGCPQASRRTQFSRKKLLTDADLVRIICLPDGEEVAYFPLLAVAYAQNQRVHLQQLWRKQKAAQRAKVASEKGRGRPRKIGEECKTLHSHAARVAQIAQDMHHVNMSAYGSTEGRTKGSLPAATRPASVRVISKPVGFISSAECDAIDEQLSVLSAKPRGGGPAANVVPFEALKKETKKTPPGCHPDMQAEVLRVAARCKARRDALARVSGAPQPSAEVVPPARLSRLKAREAAGAHATRQKSGQLHTVGELLGGLMRKEPASTALEGQR